MKKILLISGLLLSINAHAGFLLGMVVGSAMSSGSSNQSASVCMVELKPNEIVCETDSKLEYCHGRRLEWDVKDKGFKFYHRQAVCYTGDSRIMVVKVWN
jgi:hypothetical protein